MPSRSYDLQTFVAGLCAFEHYHYVYYDEPYLYLAKYTENKKVLYEQYGELLIQDAVSKGVNREEARARIDRITERLGYEMDHAKRICNLMNRKARDHRGSGKILLFPIMCGIGKTNAIIRKMKQALESKDGDSLLVLTDSNDRLRKLKEPQYDDGIRTFFAREDVQERICLFIAETKAEALRRADHAQILLMSTQRYLHLSREELERFTCCNGKRRSMIIIDEQPQIEEYTEIRFSDLAAGTTAFIQGLPYSGSATFKEEKAWCAAYWQSIADAVNEMLQQVDRESNGKAGHYHFMRPDDRLTITEEDEERFMRFIRSHRMDLDTYEGNEEYDRVTADIEAVFQMIHQGALFCSRDDTRRKKTCFKLYVSHIGQFDIPDTTIAVLDGTADVDSQSPDNGVAPMYRFHRDRFFRVNTRQCRRSLNHLYLHILDKRTGSSALIKQTPEDFSELFQDVRKRMKPYLYGTPCTVFTYKSVRNRFGFDAEFGEGNVAHFGNIKGINDLITRRAVAQIGMQQYPLEQYLLMSLIGNDEARERFLAMGADEQSAYISAEANTAGSDSWRLRMECLLIDTEQNMFRGCIRETVGNDYHYFVYCSAYYYRGLIEMMKERYKSYEGHVSVQEKSLAEEIEEYMGRGKPNKLGNLIIRTIFSFDPCITFSPKNIYTKSGITKGQYHKTVQHTPVIKQLLAYDRVGEKEYQNRFHMPERRDEGSEADAPVSSDEPQWVISPDGKTMTAVIDGQLYESYVADDDDDVDNDLPF